MVEHVAHADPPPSTRRGWSTILVIVGVGLAVRALLAAVLPPVIDEAYYADWARHLQPGYLDHPPAVAWIAAAGLRTLGWNALGLRLVPLLLQAGTTLLAASLARSLAGERAGVAAAALLAAMPVFSVGEMLALPDAPLSFGWVGTLWAAERGLRRDPRWFAVAGAFLGIGALSKLHAGLLAIALLAALLAAPDGRRALRTAWPWIGAAIAALGAAPMLLWNAEHGWATFAYQARHGLRGGGFSFSRLAGSVGGQVAFVSPVILAAAMPPALRALGDRRDAPRLAIAAAALPVVAFFTAAASFTPGALPHWPALGWTSAVILLAASGSRFIRAGVVSGLALMAAALAAIVVVVAIPMPLPPASDDPRGWSEVVPAARAAARGARLAATHWMSYGQLGFHAGESLAYVGDRPSAPSFYAEGPYRPGEPLLVVSVDGLGPQQDRLEALLGPLEPAGRFVSTWRGVPVHAFRFWRARAPASALPGLPPLPARP
jgi:4-amino-4-deoxy-L-arabinose transferase-like glycosyltransferase